MSKQIDNMKKLGFSDVEIKDILECDNKIDHDEKLFELTEEQKKASKKARQADRTPTVYKFNTRERKADEDKRDLIKFLIKNLPNAKIENLEVINAEREIIFNYHSRKFKITLSAPRK